LALGAWRLAARRSSSTWPVSLRTRAWGCWLGVPQLVDLLAQRGVLAFQPPQPLVRPPRAADPGEPRWSRNLLAIGRTDDTTAARDRQDNPYAPAGPGGAAVVGYCAACYARPSQSWPPRTPGWWSSSGAEPDPRLVELVHAGGALAGWQVGSLEEARRAVGAGCDLLVVQGAEAGGHVRGTMALLPLLASVREAVTVPVLAAGGIANARGMAAAQAFQGEVVGAHTVGARSRPLARWAAQTPSREVTGTVAAMALYAGQGVGQVTRVVPAGQVVTELAQGAERLLRRWSGATTPR